jgi:hypothetical protein
MRTVLELTPLLAKAVAVPRRQVQAERGVWVGVPLQGASGELADPAVEDLTALKLLSEGLSCCE